MLALFPYMGMKASIIVPVRGINRQAVYPDNRGMDLSYDIRTNLRSLLDAAKDGRRKGPSNALDLEAESGIGKTTIYRILSANRPIKAATLELGTLRALCKPFDVEIWQLLLPHHLFDPIEPPRVPSAAERKEIAIMRVVVQQVQQLANHGGLDADHPGTPSAGANDPRAGKDSSGKPIDPSDGKRSKYRRS